MYSVSALTASQMSQIAFLSPFKFYTWAALTLRTENQKNPSDFTSTRKSKKSWCMKQDIEEFVHYMISNNDLSYLHVMHLR